MKSNILFLILLPVLLLTGCNRPISKKWGKYLAKHNIVPVYPPSEDIQVGDVFILKPKDTAPQHVVSLDFQRELLSIYGDGKYKEGNYLEDAIDQNNELEDGFYPPRLVFHESNLLPYTIEAGSSLVKGTTLPFGSVFENAFVFPPDFFLPENISLPIGTVISKKSIIHIRENTVLPIEIKANGKTIAANTNLKSQLKKDAVLDEECILNQKTVFPKGITLGTKSLKLPSRVKLDHDFTLKQDISNITAAIKISQISEQVFDPNHPAFLSKEKNNHFTRKVNFPDFTIDTHSVIDLRASWLFGIFAKFLGIQREAIKEVSISIPEAEVYGIDYVTVLNKILNLKDVEGKIKELNKKEKEYLKALGEFKKAKGIKEGLEEKLDKLLEEDLIELSPKNATKYKSIKKVRNLDESNRKTFLDKVVDNNLKQELEEYFDILRDIEVRKAEKEKLEKIFEKEHDFFNDHRFQIDIKDPHIKLLSYLDVKELKPHANDIFTNSAEKLRSSTLDLYPFSLGRDKLRYFAQDRLLALNRSFHAKKHRYSFVTRVYLARRMIVNIKLKKGFKSVVKAETKLIKSLDRLNELLSSLPANVDSSEAQDIASDISESISEQNDEVKDKIDDLFPELNELSSLLSSFDSSGDLEDLGGSVTIKNLTNNTITLNKNFLRPHCIGYRGFVFGFTPDGKIDVSKLRHLSPKDFDAYN
ncbi:MAG: hypothetical protein HRT47_01015 [Candidatus Caenarcaniphilales bacterium]|nr:hypothetical protein [Candidatus Caenarcaniphilales bacterium]